MLPAQIHPDEFIPRPSFATTHWTLVLKAANGPSTEGTAALETLCQSYWYPLYSFVRRRGHDAEAAKDLTQEFFARLIEKDWLRNADPEKGRFRTFLLSAVQHFLSHERERAQAAKRGGNFKVISWDAETAEERYRLEPSIELTPEKLFDRRRLGEPNFLSLHFPKYAALLLLCFLRFLLFKSLVPFFVTSRPSQGPTFCLDSKPATYHAHALVKGNGTMKSKLLPALTATAIVSFALLSLAPLQLHAAAHPVVINEIQYHPGNDDERLQFIELHNHGRAEVDLSGWKLRGVKFDFPPNAKIAPGGFLVVARDISRFKSIHGAAFPSVGNLGGRIKRSGEKLELVDSKDQIVESFTFSDDPPWPLGPDGYASTLERICPTGPATDPENWAPSKRATRAGREGSPGRANDNASPAPLPTVEDVKWEKLPAPTAAIPVSATIRGANDPVRTTLTYYTVPLGNRTGQTNELAMKRVSGSAMSGKYEATIPPQPKNTLIRFFITVSNGDNSQRIYPSPNEPRPALASYSSTPPAVGRIPAATIINASRVRTGGHKMEAARETGPHVGSGAFLYTSPDGKAELFDFVEVRNRSGGWKVHFLKDQLLDGMSGINLISEGPPRWMLAEHLSYELYRRAGLNIQKSGHFRLNVDGRSAGYMLFVEQPNKTFLARSGRNNEGNLYKIQWFNQDVVGAHEKKTNRSTGHQDVETLVANLNRLKGDAQWKYIQEQFNLTNVINYFAVNMLVQNWDGFFNNYYAYHDTKPGGKWEIIPWDEDKTWGEYDGASSNYDWYEMPLTMGMNGDRGRSGWGGGGPFGGGSSWWRPPGWFSGPLLANPQFRKLFLARIKELCQTEFTEQRFGPVIQSLANGLRPEVEGRASQLDRDIQSFHRQLTNRRKFLLKELER